METPANLLTPTLFAERAQTLLGNEKNISLTVRERDWVEQQKMGAFLSVSKGSAEPLKFLEIKYSGGTNGASPLAIVGKGVTFDSGGISLKPSAGMALMKGDMGGAAVVIGTMWAISQMELPINIIAAIPLTENMPSGSATKPGDVVFASNGLSIEVDNTDAEGRLILADAIYHVTKTYKPHSLIELSTLTGAMDVALGASYAGVFTNSDTLWAKLESAGKIAGDKFWRMPLCDSYKSDIKSTVADLKNVGGRSAGSCTAAIFLNEFLPKNSKVQFAHIGILVLIADIAGVMHHSKPIGCLSAGMTGRPTRSIIEFCKKL
jgi:aminopeptidase